MEIQFHPASGRGRVRTLALGPAGERAAIAVAAVAAALASSLVLTVPGMAARRAREEAFAGSALESRHVRTDFERLREMALRVRERALEQGDLLNRVAFLYGIAPAGWPRVLDPQRRWLSATSPEALADRLSPYLRGLEKAQGILGRPERADPSRAATIPSLLPIDAKVFEAAARFGPRVSPWTGEDEFFPGVDIAAPAGSSVVSPAAGTVAFVGTVRRTRGGWFWRLGNLVVISHRESGATVFGHLARVDVRPGQAIRRGDRIGAVGASGWALSPQLHYELWRAETDGLRPTDPLFSALDRRLGPPSFSLEQMLATAAPDPLEPLPGIQINAERARGGGTRSVARGSTGQGRRRAAPAAARSARSAGDGPPAAAARPPGDRPR